MADPITAIDLMDTALKTVVQVADLVGSIRRAPKAVEALSEDSCAIEGVFHRLERSIQGLDESTRIVA